MKNPLVRLALGLALAAGLISQSPLLFSAPERWYTPAQVKVGKTLFLQNCAVCHQPDGSGTQNWKSRDALGNLPPPPLNGTAHSWHHDLETLARYIREGGAPLGGTMPAFAHRFTEAEIESLLAYIQSLWPDAVYQRWASNFLPGKSADLPAQGLTPLVL